MADSVAAQQEIDSIIDDMQQEMVDTVMTKRRQAFAQTVLIHQQGGAIALGSGCYNMVTMTKCVAYQYP